MLIFSKEEIPEAKAGKLIKTSKRLSGRALSDSPFLRFKVLPNKLIIQISVRLFFGRATSLVQSVIADVDMHWPEIYFSFRANMGYRGL